MSEKWNFSITFNKSISCRILKKYMKRFIEWKEKFMTICTLSFTVDQYSWKLSSSDNNYWMLSTLNFYSICEAVYGIQAIIHLRLCVNQVLLWTNMPEIQNCLKISEKTWRLGFQKICETVSNTLVNAFISLCVQYLRVNMNKIRSAQKFSL
jgi:hypothetical protein